jgi:hypothetical protein
MKRNIKKQVNRWDFTFKRTVVAEQKANLSTSEPVKMKIKQ